MKREIERRKPKGLLDYLSLAVTTFGVGYLPLAPGTWGSMVGVAIYLGAASQDAFWVAEWSPHIDMRFINAVARLFFIVVLAAFCFLGIWASNRSLALLGDSDPSEAVVDEVIGQLVTFLFVPFGLSWPLVLSGFLLFRLFDIWKPYPIDDLQVLEGGLGVCADDLVAGVYGGICLAVIYAVSLSI